MVTTSTGIDPDATTPVEDAERIARVVISGSEHGAIRRIVLYLVTVVLLISPVPLLAAVPLIMLALTDQLV